jgi:apolipoprotein N-acyltransferase
LATLNQKRRGQRLLPYAPAVLSALLLTLAFAPLGWWWAAWLALVPWYVTLQGTAGIWRSGRTGFLFGTVVFLVGMYWMNEIGAVPWFVLACIQAIPFALLALLAAALLPRLPAWARPFAFAALWTLLEFGRSSGRLAFPWFLLSTSQVHNLPILQLVSATGQWGLSFCVALANGFLGEAWLSHRRGGARPQARNLGIAAFAVPILLYASGLAVMNAIDRSDVGLPTRVVGAVQGAFDKGAYGDPEIRQRVLETYLTLTRDAVVQGQGTELNAFGQPRGIAFVAWPETVVPGYISQDPTLRGRLSDTARSLRTPLLIGAPEIDDDGGWLNTAYFFDRSGLQRERYDKNQLVPVGEFFPLREMLGPIYARYGVPEKDHVPGTRLGVIEAGGLTGETRMRVGTIICYESVFPRWTREDVRGGAQMIALLTSDQTFGTFGGSAAARGYCHGPCGRNAPLAGPCRRDRGLRVSGPGRANTGLPAADEARRPRAFGDTPRGPDALREIRGLGSVDCAGIFAACIIVARRSGRSVPESATASPGPAEQTSHPVTAP